MPIPNEEKGQFKPGQSGNPNGRPKKLPQLDELLADILSDEQKGMSAAEAILKQLRNMAIKGNIRAAELLLDRAYGKVKDVIDLTAKTIIIHDELDKSIDGDSDTDHS